MPFWDVYMSIGGSGVTIGLLIAIFIAGKREDLRSITKISFGPGIFNINEPVIFGVPVMLNPLMAIPFIVTPLVTGAIGYIATAAALPEKPLSWCRGRHRRLSMRGCRQEEASAPSSHNRMHHRLCPYLSSVCDVDESKPYGQF
jgi:hypothetical protein